MNVISQSNRHTHWFLWEALNYSEIAQDKVETASSLNTSVLQSSKGMLPVFLAPLPLELALDKLSFSFTDKARNLLVEVAIGRPYSTENKWPLDFFWMEISDCQAQCVTINEMWCVCLCLACFQPQLQASRGALCPAVEVLRLLSIINIEPPILTKFIYLVPEIATEVFQIKWGQFNKMQLQVSSSFFLFTLHIFGTKMCKVFKELLYFHWKKFGFKFDTYSHTYVTK